MNLEPLSKAGVIPADDPSRKLTHVNPDDPSLAHVSIVGGTYTILISGKDTAGRYCLIDLQVPPCAGPGPHRHDFEEMFTLLEGEVEFTFRGNKTLVRAGETINIPANAPHFFHNESGKPMRMLCMCTPAGQEDFFLAIGDRVESRTAAAPKLDQAAQKAFLEKAIAQAPLHRVELLKP